MEHYFGWLTAIIKISLPQHKLDDDEDDDDDKSS